MSATLKNVVPSYKPNVTEIPYGAVNFFPLLREGEFRVEMTRYKGSENDATDWTQGTITSRKQCEFILQYLKEHWSGFENAYIIDSAPSIGTICQPHLIGEKSMTKEIILRQKVMDDRIALTAYGIDLHSPDVGSQNILYYLDPGKYYGVPYGVMVPASPVENLLVAGKCVSADEDATSGVLCSGICMAMGEAAGTACAISIHGSCNTPTGRSEKGTERTDRPRRYSRIQNLSQNAKHTLYTKVFWTKIQNCVRNT